MIRISQIKIHNNGQLKGYKNGIAEPGMLQKQLKMQAAKLLRISEEQIQSIRIVKHSIDARKKPEIYDIYELDVKLIKGNDEEVIAR